MNQKIENLINLIASKSINYHDFIGIANGIDDIKNLFDPKDFSMWHTLGLPVMKLDNGKITLKSRETDICDETFCFVDIETTGGTKDGQIIEIGALKVRGGNIIGKFETFVKAEAIPQNITELTGITLEDVAGAPNLAFVLENFRLFLGEAVFVAHNAKFDYGFISHSLEKLGFGMLLNLRICTIDLARRTIPSQRYGLSALKELLGVQNTHHRAYSDAVSCYEIFKHALTQIPWSVQTTTDLIQFSKTAKSVALPKTLPIQE